MILVIIKKDERFTNIPVTIYSTTMIETIATAAMFKDAFAGIHPSLNSTCASIYHALSAIDTAGKPSV